MKKPVLLLMVWALITSVASAYAQGTRVLVVMAHPDDESTFSVTLYKIAREQHGTVDLFVITNGEAGYKYSTLAEPYYGLALTDEKVGRANLPRIRKIELKTAGKILGVHHYYFENQLDSHYSLNEREPLDTSWHVSEVRKKLNQVLTSNHYDFVFCLLPDPETHAGHKAATLLALDAVNALPQQSRPLVLGGMLCSQADSTERFSQYGSYPQTRTFTDTASFKIDRRACFSFKNRVNYKVISNWEIAAHKSQGFTQMSMNEGDIEGFWYFSSNDQSGLIKCRALFEQLNHILYQQKKY